MSETEQLIHFIALFKVLDAKRVKGLISDEEKESLFEAQREVARLLEDGASYSEDSNRREFLRVPVSLLASVGEERHPADIINISNGGLRLQLEDLPQVGDIFPVAIEVEPPLEFVVRAQWVKPGKPGLTGVAFVEPNRDDIATLSRIAHHELYRIAVGDRDPNPHGKKSKP